jgi:hypothetical protein
MERLRPVAKYHVVGIGEAIVGPWPVSLVYPGGRLPPLKMRASIDTRRRGSNWRSSTAPIAPVPGTSLVRPPDCHQTRTRIAEGPPRVEPTG